MAQNDFHIQRQVLSKGETQTEWNAGEWTERERSRGPGAGENPGANRDLPTTLFLKNHGRLE